VVPSPNVKPATNNNGLNGVSCVSASDCIAVGDQAGLTTTGTLESALIEVVERDCLVGGAQPSAREPGAVRRVLHLSGQLHCRRGQLR
jgi:hypothetical protein